MNCPICGARAGGQIGRSRYYCGECCHEWTQGEGALKIFRISEDGALISLKVRPDPMFTLNRANQRHLS